MRKVALGIAVLVLLVAGVVFMVPTIVDGRMNTVTHPGPYAASAKASIAHQALFVADLHDDALLWNRDLLQRYDRGHSDLPRLLDGHMALQVFATVTKTPKNMNYERNSADTDNVTMLAMAQRWPVATWTSLLQRALYQSDKLHKAVQDSQARLILVKNQQDMAAFVKAWSIDHQRVAAVLATEGLHPLEGKLENVDRLYDAGFRIAGLTHFFDNEVGGSAHGLEKGGLTPFGREVVTKLEAKGILIDLAHASKPPIDDVLAVPSIVRAIRYVVDKVGVAHVALGSDFNGATRTPFDVTGLPQLTEGLIQARFSEDDIRAIMGGNVQRLLLQSLPPI